MSSQTLGVSTSVAEVTHISIHGIWLLVNGAEHFLPYEEYPWFRDARVSEIHAVELLHDDHVYWPELDIDLSVDCLEHPDSYPLV